MRRNTAILITLIAILATLPFVLAGCSIEYYGSHDGHSRTYWTHGHGSNDSDEQAENRSLALAIRNKLKQNPMLQDADIGVEVDNGKAILRGRVHSTAELERAVNIARSAPGVDTLESRIVVKIDAD
jgi:osmotically-inducible protein OsmY